MMSVLPTPRIAKDAALKPGTFEAEKFGTYAAMSAIVFGASDSISASLIADTAIGVDWSFVSRRSAVTTISSSWPPAVAAGACCAWAWPADSAIATAANNVVVRRPWSSASRCDERRLRAGIRVLI